MADFYTCDDCEHPLVCLRREKCSLAAPLPLHRPIDAGNTFKGGLSSPSVTIAPPSPDDSVYGWWKCPVCKKSNTYMRKYYNPLVPQVCAHCKGSECVA